MHFFLCLQLEKLSPAFERSDAAKEFASGNRRVVIGQSVATQDIRRCWSFVRYAHNSVDAEFVRAAAQNNISAAWSRGAEGFHCQAVARIERGQHAGAVSDKSDFGELLQSLSGKLQMQHVARLCPGDHQWRVAQEFFLLKRHWACVCDTFPQANAMVSKMRSCSKDGLA